MDRKQVSLFSTRYSPDHHNSNLCFLFLAIQVALQSQSTDQYSYIIFQLERRLHVYFTDALRSL
jgi:hypothetical protein